MAEECYRPAINGQSSSIDRQEAGKAVCGGGAESAAYIDQSSAIPTTSRHLNRRRKKLLQLISLFQLGYEHRNDVTGYGRESAIFCCHQLLSPNKRSRSANMRNHRQQKRPLNVRQKYARDANKLRSWPMTS